MISKPAETPVMLMMRCYHQGAFMMMMRLGDIEKEIGSCYRHGSLEPLLESIANNVLENIPAMTRSFSIGCTEWVMATALMIVFLCSSLSEFSKVSPGGRGQRIWQHTNVEIPERTLCQIQSLLLNADWFHFDNWQVVVSWQVMVRVSV
jgi:hypothetical protein